MYFSLKTRFYLFYETISFQMPNINGYVKRRLLKKKLEIRVLITE